jgi:phage terminase Nu1 subunit (DNA packaging protein)
MFTNGRVPRWHLDSVIRWARQHDNLITDRGIKEFEWNEFDLSKFERARVHRAERDAARRKGIDLDAIESNRLSLLEQS